MDKNVDISKLSREDLEEAYMNALTLIELQNKQLTWYAEQIELAKKDKFGKSKASTYFNETEFLADEVIVEPTVENAVTDEVKNKTKKRAYKKDAASKKRNNNLGDFETKVIEYTLSAEEQFCNKCNSVLHEMKKQVRRELTIIPPKVIVTEHVSHVYSCRNCEKNDTYNIIKAPSPQPVINKGVASSSLIADIIINRHELSLPLYRQSYMYERLGVNLSSQNLANWIMKSSDLWLSKIIDHMKKQLLGLSYIHCDETTIDVIRDPNRTSGSFTSYMWVFMSGRSEGKKIVLFHYAPTREHNVAVEYLKGYDGYIQADGYGAYKKIDNTVLAGCWSHAKVKFDKVIKSAPKGTDLRKTISYDILKLIKNLFDIEKRISKQYFGDPNFKNDPKVYDEIVAIRKKEAEPIIDEIYEIARNNQHLIQEKSYAHAACTYLFNQEGYLRTYLTDGRIEISNNAVERALRPFTVGRKNSYFNDSPKGAKASSICYSLVETAKLNKLVAKEYVEHLLDVLPNAEVIDEQLLDSLMPWSPTMQEMFNLKGVHERNKKKQKQHCD